MIGDFIQKHRKRAGLSQKELGKALGKSISTISHWERTHAVPPDVVPDLAVELGVSKEELYGELDEAQEERRKGDSVSTAKLQGEWIAGVFTKVPDRDLAFVLGAIGAFLDTQHWVVSTSKAHLVEETAITEELVEKVWDDVLSSPWLKRIGRAEYTFELVFPE